MCENKCKNKTYITPEILTPMDRVLDEIDKLKEGHTVHLQILEGLTETVENLLKRIEVLEQNMILTHQLALRAYSYSVPVGLPPMKVN